MRRPAGSAYASIQAVATYYVSWPELSLQRDTAYKAGDASSLQLTTTYDKPTAKVGEEITCHVKAERIGSRGYGMMLAEVGLPPGADVDRASLETAMTGSDWAIDQYDILPDRVVLYLWPRAGGISFDLKFRTRFPLTAKTTRSIAYDYYNPDASVVVAPITFVAK